jgi:Domain of unknown function (DUF4760)
VKCDLVALGTQLAKTIVLCQPSSSPHWSVFIAPLLILISVGVAIWGVRNAREIARQKATLDLIEKRESTEHYKTLLKTFREIRLGQGFGELANPLTDNAREARSSILDYINHYELVAIGIRRNILDELMYRDWMEGAFVRDFNAAADFIQGERWRRTADGKGWVYRKSIFGNYQWAAERWSPEAQRLVKGDPPTDAPAKAVGDEHLPEPST